MQRWKTTGRNEKELANSSCMLSLLVSLLGFLWAHIDIWGVEQGHEVTREELAMKEGGFVTNLFGIVVERCCFGQWQNVTDEFIF